MFGRMIRGTVRWDPFLSPNWKSAVYSWTGSDVSKASFERKNKQKHILRIIVCF